MPGRSGTLELNEWQNRVWVKVHPLRDGGWATALARELSVQRGNPRDANGHPAQNGFGSEPDTRPLESADENVRRFIETNGVESLTVDDLTLDDLPNVGWAGSRSHLRYVERALERAAAGEVDYLAVRAPTGEPISIGGVNYAAHEGAGTLWQLATKDSLRSLGLGTRLIAEAEKRIKKRGLRRAMMGVEDDNARARQLYERLGYRVSGHEEDTWKVEDAHGNEVIHKAQITLLNKELD
jgi:ribosomal protein S18 acetylase RimI-like enzyme